MNTNPSAITVLCYGDSNTNGIKPDRNGRFASDVRWPGVMQNLLGDNYYIIEEGLGGRTTNLEHYNPDKPSRNGLTYFRACIDSHMLLDIVIIMLATNDFKTVYNRTPRDVAIALKQYPMYVRKYCEARNQKIPKMILISPPYMNEKAPKFIESMPAPGVYDENAAQKTREVGPYIEKIASETECIFFNAGPITQTGEDGCHIDAESHEMLGKQLTSIVNVK